MVQLNLNLIAHAYSNYMTGHVSENACKKPACARKIDDVAINARCTRVHMRRYSATMCIMFCMKSTCAFWFAQTALVHYGLHEHKCLIGMQSGLAYTQIIRMYKPNMSVCTYY